MGTLEKLKRRAPALKPKKSVAEERPSKIVSQLMGQLKVVEAALVDAR